MTQQPKQPYLDGDSLENLLANSVRALADEAQRVLELGGGASGVNLLRHVSRLLEQWAQRRPGQIDAAQLRRELAVHLRARPPRPADVEPDEEEEALEVLWHDLARFAQDMAYVETFRESGVAGLNAQLAAELAALRQAGAHTAAARAAAARLNDLLRRAIYLVPHAARSVVLSVERNDAAAESRVERIIGKNRANRQELIDLWQAAGGPADGACMVVRLPLPYLFHADDARAERSARRASWEDVAFVAGRMVARGDVKADVRLAGERMQTMLSPVVLVRTAFDRDLGLSREAFLLADEVARVELDAGGSYLPARSAKFEQRPAGPRPDAVMHYLLFRDFGDIGRNARLAAMLGIGDLASQSLFEPAYESGLLDVGDDEAGRQWLERGFGYLAVPAARGELRLLRFEDVEIRYEPGEAATARFSPLQAALYRAALRADDPLRGRAREFEGEAIIRELMQVPVAPRHFLK